MSRNLSNLYISESFQYLIQVSGSEFETGLGSAITSVNITASNAVSSSYALTASYAENVTPTDTGSLLVTASAALNVITFTKGDASTFDVTVDTGSFVPTDTGSLLTTASFSGDQITFTKGDGSTFAGVITSVTSSISASYAATATSASHSEISDFAFSATSASFATSALLATSASHAVSSDTAISSSYATTASFALNVTTPDLQTVTDAGNTTTNAISASGFYATDTITTQNAVVLGTASIAFLDVTFESASVIYSSGSNIFGDAADDTQTLWGTVDVKTGPVLVTGSVNASAGFIGDLTGNASTATTASFALTASYVAGVAAPGLIAGTSVDSMVSAPFLTTTPATASAPQAIALGDNARAQTTGSIAIGDEARTENGTNNISIGAASRALGSSNETALGYDSYTDNGGTTALGGQTRATGFGATAVGLQAEGTNSAAVAVGIQAKAYGTDSTALGANNVNSANSSLAAGKSNTINSGATYGVALGYTNTISTNHSQSILIGDQITSSGPGNINIGNKWIYDGLGATTFSGSLTALDGFIGDLTGNADTAITASYALTASYLDSTIDPFPYTGSAQITGSLNVIGSTTFTGSVSGEVNALSIASLTASLDCSTGNFFTLTLVNGVDTHVDVINPTPGQTINLQVTQDTTPGSGVIAFSSNVLQPSGSQYTASPGASVVDVVSMVSFDGSNVLINAVKNFV